MTAVTTVSHQRSGQRRGTRRRNSLTPRPPLPQAGEGESTCCCLYLSQSVAQLDLPTSRKADEALAAARSGAEGVANAAHGPDQASVAVSQLLAEGADVGLDQVAVAEM